MADSKYKELLRELKAKIVAGGYDEAHPFPSESAMARELALSRNTVHRAFQELRRLRLIEGRVGVAPTVTPRGAMRKIGLMVPGLAYSEFFQPIIRAVSRLAMKHGYTLIFGSMEPDSYAHGIDRARMQAMKPGAVIMHPGPVNRGVELASEAVDTSKNLILDQVNAGVSIRMAVLYLLLGGDENVTAA